VDLTADGSKLAAAGKVAKVPIFAGEYVATVAAAAAAATPVDRGCPSGYVAEDIPDFGTGSCHPDRCNASDVHTWAVDDVGLGNDTALVDQLLGLYADEVALPGGNITKYTWMMKHAGADHWAGCAARRLARWYTRAGLDAYWYKWSYAPIGPNGDYPKLAHHACEQPFVFHVLRYIL